MPKQTSENVLTFNSRWLSVDSIPSLGHRSVCSCFVYELNPYAGKPKNFYLHNYWLLLECRTTKTGPIGCAQWFRVNRIESIVEHQEFDKQTYGYEYQYMLAGLLFMELSIQHENGMRRTINQSKNKGHFHLRYPHLGVSLLL